MVAEKASGQSLVIMCSLSASSTGRDTLPRNSVEFSPVLSSILYSEDYILSPLSLIL